MRFDSDDRSDPLRNGGSSSTELWTDVLSFSTDDSFQLLLAGRVAVVLPSASKYDLGSIGFQSRDTVGQVLLFFPFFSVILVKFLFCRIETGSSRHSV